LFDKIVLATKNVDKIKEIKQVLSDLPLTILTFQDFNPCWNDIDETGATIEENAFLKAKQVALFTNLPAIADDTGLEVAALGNVPGVYSSRYAGEGSTYKDNYMKLLKVMDGELNRIAVFKTAIAFYQPPDHFKTVVGKVTGQITNEPKGKNGFGYDPVFFYPVLKKTFAEMTLREKNQISHRGKALQEIKLYLNKLLAV
jgi:XTP/dITP diphosphohydrolase